MRPLLTQYMQLLHNGEVEPDNEQSNAIEMLDTIQAEITRRRDTKPHFLQLFKRTPKKLTEKKGTYIWGGVGRGKSMLMDLFFDTLEISQKRRVHFHDFMWEIHQRLQEIRSNSPDDLRDPIHQIVDELTVDLKLLAFDELVVNNSADAMIMARLFTKLIQDDIFLIFTSNRPPHDLYKDGLNRQHFLPFIHLLEQELQIIELNGPKDYRRGRLGNMKRWHMPNGPKATQELSDAFFRLTDHTVENRAKVSSITIPVAGGRALKVPKALKGVAVFSFKRLCGEPRGVPDYTAIARRFHSIIIVGIPVLTADKRNEAARFVTLIDILYEYKVKLLAAADAAPEMLYPEGDGSFEFERTASRLYEMLTDEYLGLSHGVDDK